MSNEIAPSHPKAAEPKDRRQGSQSSKRQGRAAPGEERRKRRAPGPGPRRREGFGDGLDHAYCVNYRHRLPREFPPQDRPGLATVKPSQVAGRPDAVLLCDRQHAGPCVWPDGEQAVSDGTDSGAP
jgi:hypothetical protein